MSRTTKFIIFIFLFFSGSCNVREPTEPSLSFIMDQEGNVYHIVKIGSQKWLAENLNVSTFRNGDPILEAKTDKEWEEAGKAKKPVWCYYNNDPENSKIYGKLYNWYAVVDLREIAPVGWHVPTKMMWEVLVDYLGGPDSAGGKLKETGTTHWLSPNTGATNESGFTALPGGYRMDYGPFSWMGRGTFFWSSTAYDIIDHAYFWDLNYGDSFANRGFISNPHGFSVRCIRNR